MQAESLERAEGKGIKTHEQETISEPFANKLIIFKEISSFRPRVRVLISIKRGRSLT